MPKSNLEKKWWFELPCVLAAYFAATWLLEQAGLPDPFESLAISLVWLMCFAGFERMLSFAAWFVVLLVAPKHAAFKP